jgi:hypothetical protein
MREFCRDDRRFDVAYVRAELQGAVGQWMHEYGVSRETALWELWRLTGELQQALLANYACRLEALEAAVDTVRQDEDGWPGIA